MKLHFVMAGLLAATARTVPLGGAAMPGRGSGRPPRGGGAAFGLSPERRRRRGVGPASGGSPTPDTPGQSRRQAETWPGPTDTGGGTVCAQAGIATGQRVRNTQPDGGARGLGTSP